jgi:hypothetical protein
VTNLIKETTSVGKSTNKSSCLDFVAVFLKSKRAINEIRSVMESGNWFSSALAAVPIYQIFFSPGVTKSAFETGINIREHDWEQYASSMGSAPKIV